jgi:hypothetical protein
LNPAKYELQHILSGKSSEGNTDLIASITRFLAGSKTPGAAVEKNQFLKEHEKEKLIGFIHENTLWYHTPLKEELKIGQGAEQTVYYAEDGQSVIKLNDAVFYLSWTDYLNNLLLHNFFFPDTAYKLIGFKENNAGIFAVVKQRFVETDQPYDFEIIKSFLGFNGFENNRNFDFINKSLGVILEDLHDENVLFRNNIPYFIDTAFYLTETFFLSHPPAGMH